MGNDCRAEPRGRCRGSSGMVTVGGAIQPVALSCPQERDGYSDWQIDINQQLIGGRAELMRHKLGIKCCVVRTREQTKGKSREPKKSLPPSPPPWLFSVSFFPFLLSTSVLPLISSTYFPFLRLSYFCHSCLPPWFFPFLYPSSLPYLPPFFLFPFHSHPSICSFIFPSLMFVRFSFRYVSKSTCRLCKKARIAATHQPTRLIHSNLCLVHPRHHFVTLLSSAYYLTWITRTRYGEIDTNPSAAANATPHHCICCGSSSHWVHFITSK